MSGNQGCHSLWLYHGSIMRNQMVSRGVHLAGTTRVCMITCMIAESGTRELISHWIAAWNSHDLDAIMSHYDVNVVLISPVAAKILDHPSGTVEGSAALRNYFQRGL